MSDSGALAALGARFDVLRLCGERICVRRGCCVTYSEASVSDELLLSE